MIGEPPLLVSNLPSALGRRVALLHHQLEIVRGRIDLQALDLVQTSGCGVSVG
jgi:hypothetical protein